MNFEKVRPNSCPKCGGNQWVHKGFHSNPYVYGGGDFFEDARCLNPQCRHHFVQYGHEDSIHMEKNVFNDTPERFRKFIEDYSLENELEKASVGGMN